MNSRETWRRTLRGETVSSFTQAVQPPALRLLSQVIWLQSNTDISFRGWVQLLKSGPNVNFLKLDEGSCEGCPDGVQQPESTECPESGFLPLFLMVSHFVLGRRGGLLFTPRLGGSIGCCTQAMPSLNWMQPLGKKRSLSLAWFLAVSPVLLPKSAELQNHQEASESSVNRST